MDDIGFLEERAAEDLSGAEVLLESDRDHPTLIRFHLQQFVEKKMKASLQRHDIEYPKTHDLVVLLNLFPQEKISDSDKTFADILSQFAVGSRYGEYNKSPWSDRQMLEKAKDFVEMIGILWEGP
jgi:HEPN domain-containing protein